MRKERKAKQQNINYARLAGLVCLLLGLMFALSYAFGMVPFADKVQLYLLGKGAFLLPCVLLTAAYQLLRYGQLLLNKKTWALVLVMLCFLGTAHHVFIPVGAELEPSTLPEGGGLIGGLLALLLHSIVGEMLTYVVFAVLWLVSLYILLPVGDLWERLQDKLTEDELTLVRPAQKDDVQPLRRAKIFKEPRTRVPAESLTKRAAELAGGSVKRDIYDNEEFGAFTEGLKKESGIKRILHLGNENIYEKEPVKQEIERDPVQIPEWEKRKTEVVFRPIIDYDACAADRRFTDDVKPKEEPAYQAERERVEQAAPKTEPQAALRTEVVSTRRGIFDDIESVDAAKTDVAITATETAPQVAIYDSADKRKEHSEAVAPSEAAADMTGAADSYKLPPIDLLDIPQVTDPATYQRDIMDQCAVLEQTLADFKVRAKVIAVTRGPSVTRFELEPAPGVKVSSVVNLADDIALRLAAPGVRIEAPIPGKSAIGIEAPNTKNDPVCLREVVEDAAVQNAPSRLCIGLGKDISGNIIPADLAKMPHLLVAGSTGSGKSVCINTIIAGILYKAKPEEVKLILVDPKVVELSNYNGIPHLLTPVVTEPKKAASALHWAVAEMERRYKAFAESHVREINSYNAQAQEKMPFIVIIIDELSDLMMVAKVDVEDAILRLAQKARAAGIHLILATQRPSVDVITGIVKANIPSRIAFAVSSQTDSRTILDMGGAEKLLGKGDMLFYPIGFNKPVRVQGAFVSDAELNKIVDFIIKQSIPVNYSEEVTAQELECDNKDNKNEESGQTTAAEDELFEDALRLVLDLGQASSSMLQRRFRIGYTRAARLVDTMEELGIVGQSVGSKPREVIMSRQEAEQRFLDHE